MNSRQEFHQPPISRVMTMRGNENESQEDRSNQDRGQGARGQTRGQRSHRTHILGATS